MRRLSLLLMLSLFASTAIAGPLAARAESPPAQTPSVESPALESAGAAADWQEAQVTYQTAATVYVDAGTAKGIAEGDLLEVLRAGKVVARLTVFVASTHKSACRREEGAGAIEIGDLVRFRGRTVAESAAPGAPRRSTRAAVEKDFSKRMRELGLSGRVGLRYIMMTQSDSDFSYYQPGIDLRLRGHDIAGSGADADVDVRAYRSYRDTGSESSSESRNRVYRANVAWTPDQVPLRMVVGRQFSPSLANINIFDGALAEYTGERLTLGALAGTQPDESDYGFSSKIHEYGAYAELRSKVGAKQRWGTTLGLIGSYDGSEVNREFIYLQGRYDEPGKSLYVAQEIDVNRSWKRDAGESAISATSTYVHGRLELSDNFTLSAGLDTRRNVRLYRDYVSPVTEFDDKYRNGYWLRLDGRHGWFRSGADVRFSRGGGGGSADSYSLHLGAVRVTPWKLDIRSRSTRYDSDYSDGWLEHITVRLPIGDRVGVSVQGGVRDETSKLLTGQDTQLGWYGFDLDVTFGRHWLYLLSVERNDGDNVSGYQVYTALSYRF